jgi:hypothetical protein
MKQLVCGLFQNPSSQNNFNYVVLARYINAFLSLALKEIASLVFWRFKTNWKMSRTQEKQIRNEAIETT